MSELIAISDTIVKSVVRPISLFLNDVPKGAIFRHGEMSKGETHTLDVLKKIYPTYIYNCVDMPSMKFTNYDLGKFKNEKGIEFGTYFKVRNAKAFVVGMFEVLACEPYLDSKGNKMYPSMFYTGYADYKSRLDAGRAGDKNFQLPYEDYLALHRTDLQSGTEEKYYRTVQIDRDIFVYEKEAPAIVGATPKVAKAPK